MWNDENSPNRAATREAVWKDNADWVYAQLDELSISLPRIATGAGNKGIEENRGTEVFNCIQVLLNEVQYTHLFFVFAF